MTLNLWQDNTVDLTVFDRLCVAKVEEKWVQSQKVVWKYFSSKESDDSSLYQFVFLTLSSWQVAFQRMSRARAIFRAFVSDLWVLRCSIHRSKVCSTFWKWLQFLDGIWNMQFVPFHRLLPLRAVIRLPQNGNWLLMCRCRKFLNRVHFSYNAKSRWKLERSIKVLKVRLHHFLRVDVTKMTHQINFFLGHFGNVNQAWNILLSLGLIFISYQHLKCVAF